MCGIAGIIAKNPQELTSSRLKSMTDVIAYRGPDGHGHWISENGQVGLGHRRLSIIDLSHEADQPMHYLDNYTLIFNGEIYNYIELKEVLVAKGYQFRTNSDSEVLIALYDLYRENCLTYLDGMFAFALYDKKEQTVFIARDRFGEKPLFYHFVEGNRFVFGSEMKCLWAAGIPKEVNNSMLFNYLTQNALENAQDITETFFNDCTRLEHSHYLLVSLNDLSLNKKCYYDINWQDINHGISFGAAKDTLKELMHTSVARRLRSDVPVGSSLSGGLDSSLIVCIIDALKNTTKQHTFSAVFPGFKKDERKYMDYVIAQTNVTPAFVTPNEEGFIQDLETLCHHQEEPFGSASIYAQYCVMRLAKEHNTTVLLDGQGADEVLAGYHHYYNSFFNELKSTGQASFEKQKSAYERLHSTNAINGLTGKSLGDYVRSFSPAVVLPAKRLKAAISHTINPSLNTSFYNAYKQDLFEGNSVAFQSLNHALYSSVYTFGLQQLLRYADRNSMAHSREVRLPFLSHELVDFLFTLPSEFKINLGWTKWIMRETFDTMPNEIRWRLDKIGYEPPQKTWLENKKIKDKMQEGLHSLVKNNILHKNVLNQKLDGTEVNSRNQNYWKYLMASELLRA
jgi:asparagine synthase (glutamine-hydrolysing)